jgi:ferredoxin
MEHFCYFWNVKNTILFFLTGQEQETVVRQKTFDSPLANHFSAVMQILQNRGLKQKGGMFFADKDLFIEAIFQRSQYVVDAGRCIGCGFCAGACPCGIRELMENEPLE